MNSAMIPTIRQSQPLPSYTSLQKRESSFPTNEVLSAINVSPPETIPLSTLQKMAKINPELDNFFKKHNLPSQVRVHHIYYAQDGDKANLGIIDLIEVGSGNSKKFIEVSKDGASYKTLDDFFHNNNIGPDHYMYFDESKKIPSAYHRKATAWEQVRPITDIGIGVLTLGAAGAAIFMSSGTSAPVVLPIANGILSTSGIYFGTTSAIDVAGDLNHDRMTLRTIGNIGMVAASALPFAGAGIKGLKTLGIAAQAGTKTGNTINAMLGFSRLSGIGGNVTAITSFTAEQIQTLYEIGTIPISASLPAGRQVNELEEKTEREKMLLVATAQMLGNVGLIVITHKASGKISVHKQGDKIPAELLPKPENLAIVKGTIKWNKIRSTLGETPAAVKRFYETAKLSGKKETDEAIKYLTRLYSNGSRAFKNSFVIFAHENNLAIIPEERVKLLSTADGKTIKGGKELIFRKPTSQEIESANVYFAKPAGSSGKGKSTDAASLAVLLDQRGKAAGITKTNKEFLIMAADKDPKIREQIRAILEEPDIEKRLEKLNKLFSSSLNINGLKWTKTLSIKEINKNNGWNGIEAEINYLVPGNGGNFIAIRFKQEFLDDAIPGKGTTHSPAIIRDFFNVVCNGKMARTEGDTGFKLLKGEPPRIEMKVKGKESGNSRLVAEETNGVYYFNKFKILTHKEI